MTVEQKLVLEILIRKIRDVSDQNHLAGAAVLREWIDEIKRVIAAES